MLRDTGFFSLEPLDVGGQKVRPRDVTAALLFPKWTFEEGEADLTVMRVRVEGRENGRRVVHAWDLVDRFHEGTGLRSMSRSTGYVATSVARLVARGRVPAARRPRARGPRRDPGAPRRRPGRPRRARRPLPGDPRPASPPERRRARCRSRGGPGWHCKGC